MARFSTISNGFAILAMLPMLAAGFDRDTADKDTHWSYRPVRRPHVPEVVDASRCRNAIDSFIQQRLDAKKIIPSPPADRLTLWRRLWLDVVGLLPSPEETAAFLADTSPDAYERAVERMLASPHFGERWGNRWLDQSCYADTDGYDLDYPRPFAWRYRQWVIDSINADMPFDQFSIEQLAGDLLDDPTPDQRTATGFLRNGLINNEFGADPEEDRFKRTFDRTSTLGTVWLGTTVSCAQCHDHRYDPISQREYYGLFAFFDNLDETQTAAPLLTEQWRYAQRQPAYEQQCAPWKSRLTALEETLIPPKFAAWQERFRQPPMVKWHPLDASFTDAKHGESFEKQDDGSLLITGPTVNESVYYIHARTALPRITAIRLEALPHASLPLGGPGRAPSGDFDLFGFYVDAAPVNDRGEAITPHTTLGFIDAVDSYHQPKRGVEMAIGGFDKASGWSISPRQNEAHTAVFELAEPLDSGEGFEIRFSLHSGSRNPFETLGRFRLSVTDTPAPFLDFTVRDAAGNIVSTPKHARSQAQSDRLFQYFCRHDGEWAEVQFELDALAASAPRHPDETQARCVTESSSRRTTQILNRGKFLEPKDAVSPSTPAAWPPLKRRGERADRLDLARWLMSADHPLTARVAVNRIWQHYFGRGLVRTDDDLGLHGDPPTHPELLDWLADELVRQGWSVKNIHRLILSSATYQQSSLPRKELSEVDPYNEFVARQSRLRLDAETIRDTALDASGLLCRRIGGPSVILPQPSGREDLAFSRGSYLTPSTGDNRYRRGIYVWLQRTTPHPLFTTFDGPSLSQPCTNRLRSVTPNQALWCLNDTEYLKCAAALAGRVLVEHPRSLNEVADADARLRRMFELCTCRVPSENELQILREALDAIRAELDKRPHDAVRVMSLFDHHPGVPETLVNLTVWTNVARVMLNIDAFLVRE